MSNLCPMAEVLLLCLLAQLCLLALRVYYNLEIWRMEMIYNVVLDTNTSSVSHQLQRLTVTFSKCFKICHFPAAV